MSAIVDGFKDDLEEIRKVCVAMICFSELSQVQFSFQEPNLGPSRLALLIDSLAAGAEVFSSNDDTTINEMDVVLNWYSNSPNLIRSVSRDYPTSGPAPVPFPDLSTETGTPGPYILLSTFKFIPPSTPDTFLTQRGEEDGYIADSGYLDPCPHL